ncbi:MAG: hypothetical protein ACI9YH_004426, partial [Colwellia sp.]
MERSEQPAVFSPVELLVISYLLKPLFHNLF